MKLQQLGLFKNQGEGDVAAVQVDDITVCVGEPELEHRYRVAVLDVGVVIDVKVVVGHERAVRRRRGYLLDDVAAVAVWSYVIQGIDVGAQVEAVVVDGADEARHVGKVVVADVG